MRRVKTFGVAVFLFVVAILFNWPSLSVTVRPPVTLNAATVSAAAPSEDATRYIGSEACAECHVNEASHFAVTAHRKNLSAPASSYDRRGCEACHGGAKDHVAFQKQAAQLFKDGKDTEATALLSDETKSKASRLIDLRALSSSAAADDSDPAAGTREFRLASSPQITDTSYGSPRSLARSSRLVLQDNQSK